MRCGQHPSGGNRGSRIEAKLEIVQACECKRLTVYIELHRFRCALVHLRGPQIMKIINQFSCIRLVPRETIATMRKRAFLSTLRYAMAGA